MITEYRVTRDETASELEEIEVALLQETSVEDCALLLRATGESASEIVAYVVPNGQFLPERLHSHLKGLLPKSSLPACYVPVSRIPYTSDGEINEQDLARLEIIDSDLARRWEYSLQQLPEVERVAVVIEEKEQKSLSLHLSDLLPEWESTSKHNIDAPPVRPDVTAYEDATLNKARLAVVEGEAFREKPDRPVILQDALRRAAASATERGIVYFQADGPEFYQSYTELVKDAERILSGLRMRGLKPSDKVILQLERNEDFIPALWGCILGGFIPVPVEIAPTYQQSNSSINKLYNSWLLLDKPIILGGDKLAPLIRSVHKILGSERFEVESIGELRKCSPDHEWHASQAGEMALMLLTSGSTGIPKMVTLSHANLLFRSASTSSVNNFSACDISLNWFSLDHSGGLIMSHIRDVYLGCRQIHAPAQVILEDPLRWIDILDKHRVSLTWAPNFAFGLINARAAETNRRNWDLSSLRFILNAGEIIVPKTIRRFMKLLAPFGLPQNAMHPEWGMSEMCSTITYSDGYQMETTSDDDSFVEVGGPIPGTSIRIVDAEDHIIEEGKNGRVQVKGRSVTAGYFKTPELNARTFTSDGWFNTGDLGFLRDGRLTITGREKDVIIINGLNYFSHEIEAVVEEVEGVEVSYTAACAAREQGSNTDNLVIFISPTLLGESQPARLIKEIRDKVVRSIGINPAFVIPVEKQVIPKTEIGKIQRSLLRQRFESGEFNHLLKRIDVLTANSNTLPDCFFVKTWSARNALVARSVESSGQCLVLGEESGLGEALFRRLSKIGRGCVRVETGIEFTRVSPDRYIINPGNPDDYKQLIESLLKEGAEISHVIHLWTYGQNLDETASLDWFKQAVDAGVHSLLFLTQALAEIDNGQIQMLVVSSNSQAVNPSDQIAFEKTPAIGLIKTITGELPAIGCRHIDLPLDSIEANADLLIQELRAPATDQEIAYRNGQRYVPRFKKADIGRDRARNLPFKREGLYLITGGAGGIGLEIARFLLRRYAARVVLIGRASRVNLESLDGEVVYEQCDVSDPAQVQKVLDRVQARFQCAPDGLIHLAGVFNERLIVDETRDSLEETFKAKVTGTWVLHQFFKDEPDFLFINFSSATGFFGGSSAGGFASANRFLNSFTHYQNRATRLKSYCFTWTMWDEVGMSAGFQKKELFSARGYHILSRDEAFTSFLVGLFHDRRELYIGLDESNRHIRPYVDGPASHLQQLSAYISFRNSQDFTSKLRQVVVADRFGNQTRCQLKALPAEALDESGGINLEKLGAFCKLPSSERQVKEGPRNSTEKEIANIWSKVLGTQQAGIHDDFFDLGGDSISATQLISRINQFFGVDLPQLSLYESPTIAELAQFVEAIYRIRKSSVR